MHNLTQRRITNPTKRITVEGHGVCFLIMFCARPPTAKILSSNEPCLKKDINI